MYKQSKPQQVPARQRENTEEYFFQRFFVCLFFVKISFLKSGQETNPDPDRYIYILGRIFL